MVNKQHEISEIRREIERLRRDFAAWKTAKPRRSESRAPSAEPSRFIDKFQTAVADQLRHQHELFRIEGRVSALEKRLTELEQRCRPNVPAN